MDLWEREIIESEEDSTEADGGGDSGGDDCGDDDCGDNFLSKQPLRAISHEFGLSKRAEIL